MVLYDLNYPSKYITPNDLGGHLTSDLKSATLITLVSIYSIERIDFKIEFWNLHFRRLFGAIVKRLLHVKKDEGSNLPEVQIFFLAFFNFLHLPGASEAANGLGGHF